MHAVRGQVRALERAYAAAGVSPATVGLVALIYGNNMTLMLKPAELVSRYAAAGACAALGSNTSR